MKRILILCNVIFSFCFNLPNGYTSHEQEPLVIVHGLSGVLEEHFKSLVADFGKLHPIKLVSRGDYQSAYEFTKNNQAPAFDIIHISEFGSASLLSGSEELAAFVPADEVVPKLKGAKFVGLLDKYYSKDEEANRHLYALPFNPSMGVAYYNVAAFEKAGLDPFKPLLTWGDVFAACAKLKAAGYKPMTSPWVAAYTLEYFLSLHDRPFATNENGFKGPGEIIIHNDSALSAHFESLRTYGYIYISNNSGDVEKEFAKGQIGILMQGIARNEGIQNAIKEAGTDFQLAYGPLPYQKANQEPKCPKLGGGAFWVVKAAANKPAAKAFLEYIADLGVAARWSKMTGYLPVSSQVQAILKQGGFYNQNPHLNIAAAQAFRRPATMNALVRLPKYDYIRGPLFVKHFEQFMQDNKIKAQVFLQAFVKEANEVLVEEYKKFG